VTGRSSSPLGDSLTPRGKVIVVVGAAMALAAWLFGIEELYCLAVAALGLVGGARLWVAVHRWNLAVVRIVHPSRVPAGRDARIELAVTNNHWRASPAVDARDPFDGGRRVARFSIAPIARGESRRSSYRLAAAHRGVYKLGPLELKVLDPFGLAGSRRVTSAETTLTVHPDYELVPVAGPSSHREDDRRQQRPVIGKGGSEFFMLREYVPGDDLRHVHWPSTARLDDLVIRQPENLPRGRLTVAVDLRASVVDDETLERMVSAAASLVMSALQSGTQVRLVTTDSWDSGHGSGGRHGTFVLDGLAGARLHRPRPGRVPFRLAGGLEPVIVVTTDRAPGSDLEAAFGMGGVQGTTLVVFETAVSGPPGGQGGSRRFVRVGRTETFAQAWTVHAAMDRTR
jgi:uncharacterized protein (DUF58 family)